MAAVGGDGGCNSELWRRAGMAEGEPRTTIMGRDDGGRAGTG